MCCSKGSPPVPQAHALPWRHARAGRPPNGQQTACLTARQHHSQGLRGGCTGHGGEMACSRVLSTSMAAGGAQSRAWMTSAGSHTQRQGGSAGSLDGARMKDLESLNATFVIDTFLLLLIGAGPKIALVPFLGLTTDMTEATKRRVLRKMLATAATAAALLLVLGGLLTRLLHFSPGARGVASGIILLIIAVTMVLGQQNGSGDGDPVKSRDPMQVAVFPLAVPYLLSPAGSVVLVTLSAEA